MAGPRPVPQRRLLHVMPSFAVGGIQVRLARVINALGPRYRHTILSLDGNMACRDRLDPALAIELAQPRGGGRNLLASVLACRAALGSRAPDLLLTYNWGAIEWALANRLFGICRHVHFEDGFGPDEVTARLKRRVLMRRVALARVAEVIVPSRTLESIALGEWRLPPSRIRYVPNGIDCDAFLADLQAQPPLFARAAGETIVGTVAPLRAEKNLARLLRAFAALDRTQPIRLVIAGDGRERPMLEGLAQELGLDGRVLFLGNVIAPQRALALFDIFALSSDTEQMPMTILEAMAAGLPVAAVNVGDVKRMLSLPNRSLITGRSDEALQSVLAQLAADPARRRSLGSTNRAHVREAYPWQRMVDTYDRIFAGTASEGRNVAA